MDYIETWLDPKIPVEYIVGSFIVLCIAILFGLAVIKSKQRKWFVLCALCAEYYFLVLSSTVICRTEVIAERIKLIPFYKYPDIWNKVDHPRDLMEVLLNVVLFIPIGLLLGGACRKYKWWQIALVGCGLSFTIELLQLITARGLCETDDLVHNTLGCLIGYGVYRLIEISVKMFRNRKLITVI